MSMHAQWKDAKPRQDVEFKICDSFPLQACSPSKLRARPPWFENLREFSPVKQTPRKIARAFLKSVTFRQLV